MGIRTLRVAALAAALLTAFIPARAGAQTPPRPGRLLVTVLDQTGALLADASVTLAGLDDATKGVAAAPVKVNSRGVATFENLAVGRYSVTASSPGFVDGLVKEVRVRAGDNRQTVTLAVGVSESVSVGVDREEAASDRASTFGTALTREQVDSLPDDPDEMRTQLLGMAGDPNAVIRVDSFEGQQLPPKAQIKSIRVTRDQFSAENHYAGGISIEIITQPGIGPIRGSVRAGLYDSALDGQNPLVQAKGPGQNRNYGGSLGGSLLKDRASFSVSLTGTNSYSTGVRTAENLDGSVGSALALRSHYDYTYLYTSVDYALSRDQTLRAAFYRNASTSSNLGADGFNLADHAFNQNYTSSTLRLQEVGPLGRRFFMNHRLLVTVGDNGSQSVSDAPTIVVNDAFTLGGAQMKGSTHTVSFSAGSDLDYVRGRHAVRFGMQLDGTNYRTNATSNYNGTYTFESLDAYNAGTPRSFTERIGDPNIQYFNLQAGFYALDDIKLRKNLTLTAGLRYEVQTHLGDRLNFGPRAGVTWAPFKSGKTTLRASWGIFYDWLSTGTYEQTLRFDGFRQQSVNIANPSYPDPGPLGAASPVDRYLLGNHLLMPQTSRTSVGVQQTVSPKLSMGATFAYTRGDHLFVGQNLNAPVDGVRPDPQFANVFEATSAGKSRQKSVGVNISYSPVTPVSPNDVRRFVWTRGLQIYGSYSLGQALNDTGGPFAVPATGVILDDWGPSNEDVRHRANIGISWSGLRDFNASISLSGNSARPLNITTGLDNNGDLIFNDRPDGVGRNSARQSAQWSSYGYFSYAFTLGTKQVSNGGGVYITSTAGGLSANVLASQAVPRYRLSINVQVQNLTNHANYGSYSGVMTSSLFLKPTSASGVRQFTLSTNVSF